MAWRSIGAHLEKFKTLKTPTKAKKEAVVLAVKEHTGILLEEEDISIRGNVAFVGLKPSYKNEIFLHKKNILIDISEKHKIKVIKDIK